MAVNKKDPRSAGRIRRLKPRQRKKQRVGEFQELGFEVDLVFNTPMDGEPYDEFINALFHFLDSHSLMGGGFGGRMPLLETGGYVTRDGRGSATEEDVAGLVEWLRARPDVRDAKAGHLVDAWHGYESTAEL